MTTVIEFGILFIVRRKLLKVEFVGMCSRGDKPNTPLQEDVIRLSKNIFEGIAVHGLGRFNFFQNIQVLSSILSDIKAC